MVHRGPESTVNDHSRHGLDDSRQWRCESFQVDTQPGGAFGIAIEALNGQTRFAAVDDVTNTVSIWTLSGRRHADQPDNEFDFGDSGDFDF